MEDGIRLFVDGVAGEGACDSFPAQVRTLIMDNGCEFKKETSSPDFWTQFTREDARGITKPTLLLTGEKSLRMFQLIVQELAHRIPNNEFIILPDSTHEMPADNSKGYNETVLAFLSKHSA